MIKLNFSSAEHGPLDPEAILPVDNPRIHLFRRRSALLVISWFKPIFLTSSLGINSLCSIEPTAKEDVFLLHVSKFSTFSPAIDPAILKFRSAAWYPGLIWSQSQAHSTKKCFCATFSTPGPWFQRLNGKLKFYLIVLWLRWPKSVTAIFIFTTAISILSRQFQFHRGNFNVVHGKLSDFSFNFIVGYYPDGKNGLESRRVFPVLRQVEKNCHERSWNWRDEIEIAMSEVEIAVTKLKLRMMYYSRKWHRHTRKKEIQVLLLGVKPKNFRLLVRMLYNWATGDLWELRPLN